jgi:hypothetical protein
MPSDPELSNAVQGFLGQMWQHVDATIRALIGHHREQHEPGGKDQVRLPVHALADVNALAPDDGDILIYHRYIGLTGAPITSIDGYWEAGAGGSVGTHQAYVMIPLPATTQPPPGPVNLASTARTITRISYLSDGAVSFSATGGGYAFGVGGGEADETVSSAWASDARLSVSLDLPTGTDGTYLIVEWLF